MKGGKRTGAGRKPKPSSRLILKHCRFSQDELAIVESAAKAEGKALSRFITEASIEKAKEIGQ